MNGDAPADGGGFEAFRERVLREPSLQAELLAAEDSPAFVAVVVRLGAERGYHFTAGDVTAAMGAARRAWMERWVG